MSTDGHPSCCRKSRPTLTPIASLHPHCVALTTMMRAAAFAVRPPRLSIIAPEKEEEKTKQRHETELPPRLFRGAPSRRKCVSRVKSGPSYSVAGLDGIPFFIPFHFKRYFGSLAQPHPLPTNRGITSKAFYSGQVDGSVT